MNDGFELADKQPPQRQLGLDNQVLEFFRQWHLSGVYLRFTTFGSGQKASDANLPFLHKDSCLRADSQHFPWRDLACILQWIPSEDVVYI